MTDLTVPTLEADAAAPTLEDLMTLKARKDELLAAQAEVERQMAAAKEGSLTVLVEHLRELIVGTGFAFAEVLPRLDPNPTAKPRVKRGSGKKKATGAAQNYPIYVDPDNADNTYKRGVLPAWFKEQMTGLGLDPSKREDRETFKERYLLKTEPAPASDAHNL